MNYVDVPNSVCDLKRTPMFEWCIFGWESENGYQTWMG